MAGKIAYRTPNQAFRLMKNGYITDAAVFGSEVLADLVRAGVVDASTGMLVKARLVISNAPLDKSVVASPSPLRVAA